MAPTRHESWLFRYTGGIQVFKAPRSGRYTIECWGASGDRPYNRGGNSWVNENAPGPGAYVAGKVWVAKGTTLYVCCGDGDNYTRSPARNYNGGGAGSEEIPGTGLYSGSGGGATDVRLGNSGILDSASLLSRIMVAAGGGGGVLYYRIGPGGAGGGITGYLGGSGKGTPADQRKGGANTGNSYNGNPGVLGRGGDFSSDGNSRSAGGGSGLYGGPGGPISPNAIQAGGGGSSYISGHPGCSDHKSYVFDDTRMIDGLGYAWTDTRGGQERMPNPLGGFYETGKGHTGKGYCRISI